MFCSAHFSCEISNVKELDLIPVENQFGFGVDYICFFLLLFFLTSLSDAGFDARSQVILMKCPITSQMDKLCLRIRALANIPTFDIKSIFCSSTIANIKLSIFKDVCIAALGLFCQNYMLVIPPF